MYSLLLSLAILGAGSGVDKDEFKMGGATASPVIVVQAAPDPALLQIKDSLDQIEKRLARLENKPAQAAVQAPAPVAAPVARAPVAVATQAPVQTYYYTTPAPVRYTRAPMGYTYGAAGTCTTGNCPRR